MDILDLYSRLKNSYKEYISSFVRIKDKRIEDVVTKAIHREKMWPKALIQFNPNYAKGIGIAKMIENGLPMQYVYIVDYQYYSALKGTTTRLASI